MTEMTQFTIGAAASCADGVCGEVSRVVVDPVAQAVTHLVIEPKHRPGLGRLVPLGLLDTTAGQIRLHCTMAEFEKLDSAEQTQFVPGTSGYAAYRPDQVVSWPYYGLGGGPGAAGSIGLEANPPQTVTYDRVPLGEVAVHRGDHVHATDSRCCGRHRAPPTMARGVSERPATGTCPLLRRGQLPGGKSSPKGRSNPLGRPKVP